MKHVVLVGVVMAAAALPAQAVETDVVLSGTFGISASQFDSDLAGTDADLENNASRFAIFGSTEENGIKAFLNYERAASNDGAGKEDVREYFGGVTGAYGAVIAGRKSSAYKVAGQRLDPFYDTSLAGFNGQFASEGASYGLSNLTNGFSNNTLQYESPDFMGFSGNTSLYLNDNSETQGVGDEHDFGLGVNYGNAGWGMTAGLQILKIQGAVVAGSPITNPVKPSSTALRLHGTYAWRGLNVGASFEQVDVDAELNARSYGYLSATYQLMEKLKLALALGFVDKTEGAAVPFNGTGASFGAFYDLLQNLTVYGGLRSVQLDAGTPGVKDEGTFTITGGVSYGFDVDLE